MDIEQTAETIIDALGLTGAERELQRIQTMHRLALIDFWGIKAGDRVLEIGCGQGDTSAALAWAVGPYGFVHATDVAPESFGAPINLGEATARLKASALGPQLQFSLGEKNLRSPSRFSPSDFDHVVLSHCAWYFSSREEWVEQLRAALGWANRLCIAEWDIRASNEHQWAHSLAVLLQAQQEAIAPQGESNVRTLLTPEDLLETVHEAGWQVDESRRIRSHGLQDGQWEIEMATDRFSVERDANLPEHQRRLLSSIRSLIRHHASMHGNESLETFAMLAQSEGQSK